MINEYAIFINEQMKLKELSINKLAKLAGVPYSTVAQIAAGKVTPQIATYEKICGALGYDLILMKKLELN